MVNQLHNHNLPVNPLECFLVLCIYRKKTSIKYIGEQEGSIPMPFIVDLLVRAAFLEIILIAAILPEYLCFPSFTRPVFN